MLLTMIFLSICDQHSSLATKIVKQKKNSFKWSATEEFGGLFDKAVSYFYFLLFYSYSAFSN